MADACGISLRLFDRWLARYVEFAQACLIGKEQADARVERALYQRAIGYDFEATKIIVHNGQPMAIRYRTHMPPDSDAIKFWLRNRKRHVWQNDPEKHPPVIEINNIIDTRAAGEPAPTFDPIELKKLDEESLARLLVEHLSAA